MKKSFIMLASAAIALMAASCADNKAKCDDTLCVSAAEKAEDVVYTGMLPAADAAGVQYILKLDYSDSEDAVKGEYDLYEVYIAAGTEGSLKNAVDVTTDGVFVGFEKDGKNYIKLEGVNQMYFAVDTDSTVTMVNADLEAATTGLNYTLNLVK